MQLPWLTSRERNTELLLLGGAAAFAVLGWRALDLSGFAMPEGDQAILSQFLLAGFLGHIGLRIVAPAAAGQPYAIALLLTAVGVVFAVRLEPDLAQDQVNWVTLGVIGMVAAAGAARWYPRLQAYTYSAALVAIVLLVATGVFGTTINGARLWVIIAGQTIQTTELIKLFLIIFLAGFLASRAELLSVPKFEFGGRSYSALPYILPLVGTVLVAIMALALLKDLGSVALLILLSVASLYVATGRLRFVIGGVTMLAVTALGGYYTFDHARVRIDTWLDPYSDAGGAGYQSIQATYAIQAGGVTGEGLGQGQPDLIPAVSTDYVFSAISEELGLAGGFGVVLLYVLLSGALLRSSLVTADQFGRLLCACVALLIGIQAAVIIAGNLRLIPTTGITLPFVSYGGSSLLVNFALVGLALGVGARRVKEAA